MVGNRMVDEQHQEGGRACSFSPPGLLLQVSRSWSESGSWILLFKQQSINTGCLKMMGVLKVVHEHVYKHQGSF